MIGNFGNLAQSKFIMRSGKNYTVLPDVDQGPTKYWLYFDTLTYSEDRSKVEPYTGNVLIEYRQNRNPPHNNPGYISLDEMLSWPGGTLKVQVQNGYHVVEVHKRIVPDPAALIYRAKPVDADYHDIGIDWSEWVQVNHGTRYGLLETTRYWPTDPATEAALFAGESKMYDRTFKAVIGYASIDHFHRSAKKPPVTGKDADAVMYFVKSNRYGYIVPALPWDRNSQFSFWHNGQVNTLLWIQKPIAYGDNNPAEKWLVYNAGECYALAPPQWPWQDPNYLKDEPYIWRNTELYQAPGINNESLRDYILAPEYVGRGWGIAVDVHRHGGRWSWIAQANIYLTSDLPGLSGYDEPVLQLKYYESPAGFMENDSISGNREDWFLSQRGPIRIEGRHFGGPQSSIGPSTDPSKTRYPAAKDPDIFYREVMKYPHYCLTRVGYGLYSGSRETIL